MKKILLIAAIIVLFIWGSRQCRTTNGTPINNYQSTVADIHENVLDLTSGIHARLLGVEPGRTDVEMFLRSQFLNKPVSLMADSHSAIQTIVNPDDTVDVYVNETGLYNYCINRQAVNEYPDCYQSLYVQDSLGWITPDPQPTEKKNLALYMKQRTFLIQTPEGIGTGFFINKDGLAVTNWHVLKPEQSRQSIAVLYQDSPDDSQIYSDKKRNIRNIKYTSPLDQLDITIFTVELEPDETVPYFDITRQRPNQGDEVATYGNPHGLTASYTKGVISAFRKDPYNPSRGVDLVQYDMTTNGGNSGGPVADKYGRIIAVHELGDKTMQNTNYGIDVLQVRQILDRLNLKYGGR